jgi:signal transduction histidine kinase
MDEVGAPGEEYFQLVNIAGGLVRAARVHPSTLDVLLAAAVAVAGFTAASTYVGPRPWLIGILAALATLPLAVRRLFPVPVLVVVVAVAAIVDVGYRNGWWPFAVIVALYTVAAHCPRRTAIIAGGLTMLVLLAALSYRVNWSPLSWHALALVAGRLALLLAAWLLGDNVRTRRAYLRAVEERAEQLEREHEANARRAAAEEQARIAREVHDVVAHNLSVIVVQATAAERVFASDPADAQAALHTIGLTARRALDELRLVLGRIGEQEHDLAPQPTLRRLDVLLDQVRAAGLAADLEVKGERVDLPPGLELSAYRIVQEALTNTLRHANARHAVVTLEFGPETLNVEVTDDGHASAAANGDDQGRGLIGMRERAAAYGGKVEVGSNGSGGFRVAATFPLLRE